MRAATKHMLQGLKQCAIPLALLALPVLSYATGNGGGDSSLPGMDLLNTVMTELKGPIGYALMIICVVFAGAVIMFSDLSSGGKWLVKALLGGSVIVGATTLVSQFIGGSAGLLII